MIYREGNHPDDQKTLDEASFRAFEEFPYPGLGMLSIYTGDLNDYNYSTASGIRDMRRKQKIAEAKVEQAKRKALLKKRARWRKIREGADFFRDLSIGMVCTSASLAGAIFVGRYLAGV